MDDPASRMAHLLRRAGFGASAQELQNYLQLGLDAAVTQLVNPEMVPDQTLPPSLSGMAVSRDKIEDQKALWIYRMIHTPRPLQEKMVLFWHGHFATANAKVQDARFMRQQNELFRQYALGNFHDLLLAVAKDPAMLIWLDGALNDKAAPNENFAREVMELFSLGIHNYTETDVRQAARAFTGWRVKDKLRTFFIDAQQHDFSTKTFLGQTGRFNGDDIIGIIMQQPANAQFMGRKLVRFFVTDADVVPGSPLEDFVNQVAKAWTDNNSELKPVMDFILRSDYFYSAEARMARYKSPAEFVAGTLRQLGVSPNEYTLPGWTRGMGQDLYDPPTVKGWDGGSSWINTSTLLQRINFAEAVATNRNHGLGNLPLAQMVVGNRLFTADPLIDHFVDVFGITSLPAEARASLTAYLQTSDRGNRVRFAVTAKTINQKVRGLIRLIVALPEYQLA